MKVNPMARNVKKKGTKAAQILKVEFPCPGGRMVLHPDESTPDPLLGLPFLAGMPHAVIPNTVRSFKSRSAMRSKIPFRMERSFGVHRDVSI